MMRLSDAIRKGSQQRPQGYGSLFQSAIVELSEEGFRIATVSCALGAAYEGLFGTAPEDAELECLDELEAAFPILKERRGNETLMDGILLRNDHEKLTREQIADWLDEQGVE